MAQEISMTPLAFRGIWFHTTAIKPKICSNGWNAKLLKNSIYGAAVYLFHKKWDIENFSTGRRDNTGVDLATLKNFLTDSEMIACVLALQSNEVLSNFPLEDAPQGNSENQLLRYLNTNVPQSTGGPKGIRRFDPARNSSISLRFTMSPGPGSNSQNTKIADYFLGEGVKAIKFSEHGVGVLAVFDPSCIRVLPAITNLDERTCVIFSRKRWTKISW
jgi:hypothetical protein